MQSFAVTVILKVRQPCLLSTATIPAKLFVGSMAVVESEKTGKPADRARLEFGATLVENQFGMDASNFQQRNVKSQWALTG